MDNPKRFVTKGLTELGNCKNGMNFNSHEAGISIHCVGVGDVKDLAEISDMETLTMLSLNSLPAPEYLLQDEDIVFVRSNGNKNLVGRCVVVYPHREPLTFSGFCIRFRRTSNEVITTYLLHLLKQPTVRAKLIGRGANIQNLNQKILAALSIPLPPLELQEQFATIVKQLDKSKFNLQIAIYRAVWRSYFQ